jgi:hypothetical protein
MGRDLLAPLRPFVGGVHEHPHEVEVGWPVHGRVAISGLKPQFGCLSLDRLGREPLEHLPRHGRVWASRVETGIEQHLS